MLKFYNYQYEKNMVSIQLGEYYVTEDDVIIHTILGSCISVCLYVPGKNITGMNHFMLPANPSRNISTKPGQYGINSMELLFSEFVKKGVSIKSLNAKVFGGGNITRIKSDDNVGNNNIKFITEFLDTESIPIKESDVGGFLGRRLLYYTRTHEAIVTNMKQTNRIETEERRYQKILQKNLNDEPDISFFK